MRSNCAPLGRVKIRILDLTVLSEDASDFVYDGLYVVSRLGPDAQRTNILCSGADSAGGRCWNEVFMFHFEGNPPEFRETAPTLSKSGLDITVGQHISTYHDGPSLGNPSREYILPQQPHEVKRGLLAPPWMGGSCALPAITLELWRHSLSSDDCLARYQFCIPLEMSSGNIADRVVRLASASSYSVQFALRIRVALSGYDGGALGFENYMPAMSPANLPVLWRH
ncbi:hypothetical protein, conserved [Trypanosoma brucei gambiense DAL972]|uniref:Uncharacterized protein n=2 Tax=Trypanosoma brucei TaxID=5691 RepID=C9ZN80_TRYB9|nr:hypothetical protein, conserved [Trypanosoma brucei gambiense DAL972]RHW72860.1 hypothetical protein DPX39_040072900 [Trypanosoma brucei equiperdum]CBH10734.1 hypothetical protein, conserved [Trypanosoma brucei gambiense DAL972]|eukprot:XP_011773022.1 hypothetical protein, conserved [Trypanosoma brucei gambiense DAL972]